MSRLAPPDISGDPGPGADFLPVVPPEGIDRVGYMSQYRRAIRSPISDMHTLTGELHGWCGALGRKAWFGERYCATSALMARSRQVRIADAETIANFGEACHDAVAPLSRYTAGWFTSLADVTPVGLRKPIGVAVREARRAAARSVRRSLAATPAVHESFATVRDFALGPGKRTDADEVIALDTFATAIAKLVHRGFTGDHVLTDADRADLADLGDRVMTEFGAVPDEPLSDRRRDELRGVAVEFLNRVIAERFGNRAFDPDHLAEAYERVVTTYVNRLHAGKALEGTEFYLLVRLDAVRIDEWRRGTIRRRRQTHLVTGDDQGSARADDRLEDTTAPSDSGPDDLLRVAATLIGQDRASRVDGELCWEARTAMALLTAGLDLDGSQQVLRETISGRWQAEQPGDSRSQASSAAEMTVLLMMQTAVTRARRVFDAHLRPEEAS